MNERAKKNLYCPIVQLAEHRSLKPLYPSEGGSLGSSPSGAAIFKALSAMNYIAISRYICKEPCFCARLV